MTKFNPDYNLARNEMREVALQMKSIEDLLGGRTPTREESEKIAVLVQKFDACEKQLVKSMAATAGPDALDDPAFADAFKSALATASGEQPKDAPYFADQAKELGDLAASKMLRDSEGGAKSLDPSGSLNLITSATEVAKLSGRNRWVALLASSPGGRTISTGQFPMLRQVLRTNAADVVPASTLKPTSTYEVEQVLVDLSTIAHVTEPIDRKLLQDHASLSRWVANELVYGVALKIDQQVINGTGVGDQFEGVLATSGTQAQAFATDVPTTLRKARTKLENIGKSIDQLTLVMNPADIEALELEETTDGAWKNIVTVEDSGISRIFGVRLMPTPAIAAGVAVMADWSSARFHQRTGGVEIAWAETGSYVDGEDSIELFTHNLLRARGELRAGFAVELPGDFVVADLTA